MNSSEIYDENVTKLLGISPDICSIGDAETVHEVLVDYNNKQLGCSYMPHYRGERYFGWDIIPNIFRGVGSNLTSAEGKENERKAANQFIKIITESYGDDAVRRLFDNTSYGKQWNALFQAQHAGIKTTLLDWSARIDRAIYFAVEKDNCFERDAGQLWVYLILKQSIVGDCVNELDSYDIKNGMMLNITVDIDDLDKRLWEKKINNQFGTFYVSACEKCSTAMNQQPEIKPHLFRFRIPAEFKTVIRGDLDKRNLDWNSIHIKENEPKVQEIIDSINADAIKKYG